MSELFNIKVVNLRENSVDVHHEWADEIDSCAWIKENIDMSSGLWEIQLVLADGGLEEPITSGDEAYLVLYRPVKHHLPELRYVITFEWLDAGDETDY